MPGADSGPPRDPRPALDEIDVRRIGAEVRRRLFGIESAPITLGRFRIDGVAGNGAMGLVYVAYDPLLQRRIALKVIRPRHRSTRSGIGAAPSRSARLLQEARSLAKLTHPNVVPVYEVGELDGEVFVAMELVEGTDLRSWISDAPRSASRVLRIFDQAMAGLAAAHAAGLVHRDFKPDNVLIGTDGRVKVADFGLASELDSTDPGTPGAVAGTPAYMAPEIVAGAPATAASDQYSVGISLFEALHGHRPSSPPPEAARSVPRWIDQIVQRATASEPEQRYRSVEELQTALRRDPARRRRQLGAIGLVLATVGGAYGLGHRSTDARCTGADAQLDGLWDPARRREVEDAMQATGLPYADTTWRWVSAQLDAYAEDWVRHHTDACEATAVRREQSTEVMERRMACLRRARVTLSAVIDQLARADESTVEHADRVTGELPALDRCADVDALPPEAEPADEATRQEREFLQAELARARVSDQAGHFDEAVETLEQLEARADAQDHGAGLGSGLGSVLGEIQVALGLALDEVGRYEDSTAALERALRFGLERQQWAIARKAASTLVFVLCARRNRADEGRAYGEVAQGLLGTNPDPDAEIDVRTNLAVGLQYQGRYAEAEAEFRAVLALELAGLGPDHPDVANTRTSLGGLLNQQGKYAEAEAELRTALEVRRAVLGPNHPHVATTHANLGNTLQHRGQYAQAEAEFRTALDLMQATMGSDHPHVAMLRINLGGLLTEQGRLDAAQDQLSTALALLIETKGLNAPEVAACRANLSNVLAARGQHEQALVEDRAVVSVVAATHGEDHAMMATARNNLGSTLHQLGRHAEAEVEYRAALALLLRNLGPHHLQVARAHTNLGNTLMALGRLAEAEDELRLSLSIFEEDPDPSHPGYAWAHSFLGEILEAQGQLEEAETEYRAALGLLAKALGPDHAGVAEIRTHIGRVLIGRGEDLDEARELLEAARAQQRRDDILATKRAATAQVLARLLWTSRATRSRARALAYEAREIFVDAGPVYDDRRAELDAWLQARGESLPE